MRERLIAGAGGLLAALLAVALDALTDRVIYEDHCGAINVSARYYPVSEEALALFEALMTTARPREARP
jgi:hypothetical protein